MKLIKRASATWKGSLKEGKGLVSTQSKSLDNLPLSFKSRTESNEPAANPEELIGAAHAGCFSMSLALLLGEQQYTADSIDSTAKVVFENGGIARIELELNAEIPNISDAQFQEIAQKAKENCPVSRLFNAEITLQATLLEKQLS